MHPSLSGISRNKTSSTRISRGAALLTFVSVLMFAAALPAQAQTESVLYNFCSGVSCSDGNYPYAGLIMDQEGNLYGTTEAGGANLYYGTVFKLTPAGIESVLYSFCPQSGCKDGQFPYAGLIMDTEGNLYGTTFQGGAYGGGTVFKLTPAGVESVLYSFCYRAGCADGANPYAGLITDQEGNFYGTTEAGGANNSGTVFKLTPTGTETVLYTFCAQADCRDGAYPFAGLIMDATGNLYGTTEAGGAGTHCPTLGCGAVFKVAPTGTETVLYSFCPRPGCKDGFSPRAGLVADKKGNLYGTTAAGGRYGQSGGGDGTVFKLTPAGKESVLYNFTGATDGDAPFAGLVMDEQGNLYGTSSFGNGADFGAVFELTRPGKKSHGWTFTSLHDFDVGTGDGLEPRGALLRDSEGNLYGTTYEGGANNECESGCGTVFKVTP